MDLYSGTGWLASTYFWLHTGCIASSWFWLYASYRASISVFKITMLWFDAICIWINVYMNKKEYSFYKPVNLSVYQNKKILNY